MNPFILSSQDRLEHWKQFRRQLPSLPETEQLNSVAKYWALAPLAKVSYDVEDPMSWPTPWEMISQGIWCRNSVAIGMEFTLRLSGWKPQRLQLAMLRDYELSEQTMIVIIDDSKVMNYTYSVVVDYPNTKHEIVGKWQFSGKFCVPVA
jgi:hypothetical protein